MNLIQILNRHRHRWNLLSPSVCLAKWRPVQTPLLTLSQTSAWHGQGHLEHIDTKRHTYLCAKLGSAIRVRVRVRVSVAPPGLIFRDHYLQNKVGTHHGNIGFDKISSRLARGRIAWCLHLHRCRKNQQKNSFEGACNLATRYHVHSMKGLAVNMTASTWSKADNHCPPPLSRSRKRAAPTNKRVQQSPPTTLSLARKVEASTNARARQPPLTNSPSPHPVLSFIISPAKRRTVRTEVLDSILPPFPHKVEARANKNLFDNTPQLPFSFTIFIAKWRALRTIVLYSNFPSPSLTLSFTEWRLVQINVFDNHRAALPSHLSQSGGLHQHTYSTYIYRCSLNLPPHEAKACTKQNFQLTVATHQSPSKRRPALTDKLVQQ